VSNGVNFNMFLHCMCAVMMQIADASVLPNVVEFNITVAAARMAAYDVILTGGSAVFTITGTDGISSPSAFANRTDFTITDNSLLKWTRALLSKSPRAE